MEPRISRSRTARTGAGSNGSEETVFIRRRARKARRPAGSQADCFIIKVMRERVRVELAFDLAIPAEKTAISDTIPFSNEMRGHENRAAPLRFAVKQLLEARSPARIQTQTGFIEQKN